MDNFKKPDTEQEFGIMVRFKPENWLHDNLCEFLVTWEDLFLLLNMKPFDASVMRCFTL
jgi:hypothetical protein